MDSDLIKDEIKRRIDIADVISQYVPLQRAGRRLKACCPFHQEKTPSFYVDPQGGFWKCFGCGAGGDVFSFVMQMEGLTFVEAGERLAEKVGLEWKTAPDAAERTQRRREAQSVNDVAAAFFADNLYKDPSAEHARAYVKKRGFTGETVKLFRLGYALDGWDGLLRHLRTRGVDEATAESMGLVKLGDHGGRYDVFRNRLMFPITDVTGKIIAFGGRTLSADDPAKYLNSPETSVFKKGQTVYALSLARQAIAELGYCIVVEGYTDVISLHQAGIRNVVACLGTAMTADHLKLLRRYTERVTLTYDADAAGMQAALRNVALFEGSGVDVRVAVLPPGEDPDECVRRVGQEGFRELLSGAVPVAEYELRMVFAKYADQGADGLARAAQEATEILARIPDRVRRDEFISRAADSWGAGNAGRTEMMERALRLELQRHLASSRAPRLAAGMSPRDRGHIFETAIRHANSPIPLRVGLLQEEILAPALNDRDVAVFVLSRLSPEEFPDESLRSIAEVMAERVQDTATSLSGVVFEAFEGNEAVLERLYDIALPERPPLDRELLEANIAALKRYLAAGGLQELFEVDSAADGSAGPNAEAVEDFAELEKRVIEKLSSGDFDPDDPDVARFMQAQARVRGRGSKEYVDYDSTVTARERPGPQDAGIGANGGE
jgi:DNA primase catalytic core